MDQEKPGRILIVDEDTSIAQGLKPALERYSIGVENAKDHNSALYLFNQNNFPIVLIDLNFPEVPGLVMVQKWRNHSNLERRNCSFIVTAGNRNGIDAEELKLIEELGDIQLVYKPLKVTQLLSIFQKLMLARQRRLKLAQVSSHIQSLGSDPSRLDEALKLISNQSSALGDHAPLLEQKLYEDHGMLEEALGVVEKGLRKKPDDIAMLNSKGRILLKLGRVPEALKAMEIADKIAPLNVERMNNLAMAYLAARQPDQCVNKMRQLIQFHPEDPEYKFGLFGQLVKAGFDEHAQSLCKETSNPKEVVRHYNNHGVALAKSGKLDEAIDEYKKCILFYPTFKEVYRIYYNLALAHAQKRKKSDVEFAIDALDECLKLNPRFEKASKTKETLIQKKAG